MELELLENTYSVYKLSPKDPIDGAVFDGDFASVTKTKEEISVVAPAGSVARCEAAEDGWRILKIRGTLDFGLIGIISKISAILADANISVFVLSTYNTDYIMIKEKNAENAIRVLRENGYIVMA
jgi:hypothetical protein